MIVQTIIVTIIFYFILKYFNTANLGLSTLSVTTSFIAVYLTYKRSPVFALAYAANDIVLIFLWTLAMIEDQSYTSVLICFVIFFINDMYGYLSWQKMKEAQRVE
ncbi:TPA: nicotinamide mononucleotide transporter [Streptococcus suis]